MEQKPAIILFHDNASERDFLRKTLESEFNVVAEGGAVNEVFQACAKMKPALILIDLMSDRVGGPTLLKALLNLGSEAKKVVISGVKEEGMRRGVFQLGADDYLIRPFTGEWLRGVLSGLLNTNANRELDTGDGAVLSETVDEPLDVNHEGVELEPGGDKEGREE